MYEDDPTPPNCIQIEPVQGCNLGCDFCGIHAIGYERKARGLDFMTDEIAQEVAYQAAALGWNPRIEFAMHGEPTLHPDLASLIRPFRARLPDAYLLVTSNGGGLLRETQVRVKELFAAGLNTLALDDYDGVKLVDRFVENMGLDSLEYDLAYYPQDRTASPHTRHRGQRIIVVQDLISASRGTHSLVHNSAGDAGPLDFSMEGKRCAKPFREISVRWDGNVAMCCNDWSGTFKVGNVLIDGLETIWKHPRMRAARRALYHGQRSALIPCRGCNAVSYRLGLLPDKKGKESLPEPDADDLMEAEEAIAGEPYTSRVRPVIQLGSKPTDPSPTR